MSNIFKQNQNINEKVKRNNFDLSFQNHLTMKFGTLYPVFCKEVVPGDSFRIDSAFGLKFMPMVFPVQSGMRATMQFFYCRNKNLWKNWENWISNLYDTKVSGNITHPYLDQSPSFYKTGSLADYLDIPTTVVSTTGKQIPLEIPTPEGYTITHLGEDNVTSGVNFLTPYWFDFYTGASAPFSVFTGFDPIANVHRLAYPIKSPILYPLSSGSFNVDVFDLSSSFNGNLIFLFFSGQDFDSAKFLFAANMSGTPINGSSVYSFTLSSANISIINQHISLGEKVFVSLLINSDLSTFPYYPYVVQPNNPTYDKGQVMLFTGFSYNASVTTPVDTSTLASVPYGSSGGVRINALPFRAYESIYRCYYAQPAIQKLIIGGVPQYNKYITTDDDGADATDYHLFQRNYEMDFLTSSLPSPQQGNAPLVGISSLGTITIEDESGITTAKALVGANGDEITGVQVTSPVASEGHAITLAEISRGGFTISDFRQTNALTRWLECNMRKGYRYRDFIAGHFGKEPEYRELDLPEFIGGYSRDVTVNSILNQTASPEGDPLGAFAGTANCFGGSKHSISHYCDDFGWIIGILCVVPTPAYSQLLPKHFIKSNPLDYYFNEFSQLGMQPVTYEEVCPTQAWLEYLSDNTKKLQDTFGYQRPNYDMVAYTDQVHGNFRTDLRNFLINRIFGNRPELSSDFLQIKPEEVNDIFAVTTPDEDVIAGQVVFKVHAKRPIPRVSIPSLGR